VAPEFAESLASPDTTPAFSRPGAPPPTNPSAPRDAVVAAVISQLLEVGRCRLKRGETSVRIRLVPVLERLEHGKLVSSCAFTSNSRRYIEGRFSFVDGDTSGAVSIIGQSAGAGTAMQTPGRHPRVVIAGFRPPEDPAAVLEAGPISVHRMSQMPIQGCGQNVSALRGKADARLSVNNELRAKRQPSARESIYRSRPIVPRYTGGRAKVWCLLIHAETSLSLFCSLLQVNTSRCVPDPTALFSRRCQC
jgi:hypothetical protein